METRKGSTNCTYLSLAAVILACAPQGGIATPPAAIDRIHVESQNTDLDISSKVKGTEARATLQFPALLVWQALPRVYADLEIPTATFDPANNFVAGAVSARRSFAGKPLSNFLDCGTSAIGPNANSYNVRVQLQTQVDSVSGSESVVRSVVTASAASEGGITVRCSSKGSLERMIVDRLAAALVR